MYEFFAARHPRIAQEGPLAIVEFCYNWTEKRCHDLESLVEAGEDNYECMVADFVDRYMEKHKKAPLALAKNAALVERMRGGTAINQAHRDRRKASKLLRKYKSRLSSWSDRKWRMIKKANYAQPVQPTRYNPRRY